MQGKNFTNWVTSPSLRSSQIIPFWPPMILSLSVTVGLASPHSCRSCFALHKRKCQGLREWEVGASCKHLQRQLWKQLNFPPRNKRRSEPLKGLSSHPQQQVQDPLRHAARVTSSPNAKHVITTPYVCSVSKVDYTFVCAFVERVSLLHFSA